MQTEKISDQNPGMFWRAGVFEIRYFFFFIAAPINGEEGAEQHRTAEEIPEVRLSDQVADGKYSRAQERS
nr:hypothetical protein [Bacillus licheniformis]